MKLGHADAVIGHRQPGPTKRRWQRPELAARIDLEERRRLQTKASAEQFFFEKRLARGDLRRFGQGTQGVAGAALVLREEHTGRERGVTTFTDGSYYLLGVRPKCGPACFEDLNRAGSSTAAA